MRRSSRFRARAWRCRCWQSGTWRRAACAASSSSTAPGRVYRAPLAALGAAGPAAESHRHAVGLQQRQVSRATRSLRSGALLIAHTAVRRQSAAWGQNFKIPQRPSHFSHTRYNHSAPPVIAIEGEYILNHYSATPCRPSMQFSTTQEPSSPVGTIPQNKLSHFEAWSPQP
jgi:hypothetical protein